MRHFPPACVSEVEAILTVSARCWRAARDSGLPVQPALFQVLEPSDQGLLAPVFDSLFTLYETALGRSFAPGQEGGRSEDERLLFGFLDGTAPRRVCLDCPEGAASAFDCAICSTRIMIGLAAPPVCDALRCSSGRDQRTQVSPRAILTPSMSRLQA